MPDQNPISRSRGCPRQGAPRLELPHRQCLAFGERRASHDAKRTVCSRRVRAATSFAVRRRKARRKAAPGALLVLEHFAHVDPTVRTTSPTASSCKLVLLQAARIETALVLAMRRAPLPTCAASNWSSGASKRACDASSTARVSSVRLRSRMTFWGSPGRRAAPHAWLASPLTRASSRAGDWVLVGHARRMYRGRADPGPVRPPAARTRLVKARACPNKTRSPASASPENDRAAGCDGCSIGHESGSPP